MLDKIILLIIANSGYHPVEYGYTRKALEDAKVKVVVASNLKSEANAKPSENHSKVCNEPKCVNLIYEYPQFSTAKVDLTLDEVDIKKYDGIFIIGGPGAMEFLDNEIVYKIMQDAALKNKPFGAICVSPRILANATVLKGKKATGWNGDNKLDDIFINHNVSYIKEPVVIDGNLITADGPDSAISFGNAILKVLNIN